MIGTTVHVIIGYRLDGAGNATSIVRALVQEGNTTNIPKLGGIAAFVHTQSSIGTTFHISVIIIIISILFSH